MPKLPYHSELFNKLLNNQCSASEAEEILKALSAEELDKDTSELILKQINAPVNPGTISQETREKLLKQLNAIISTDQNQDYKTSFITKHRWWLGAAALLIIFSGISAYQLYFRQNSGQAKQTALLPESREIVPAGNKAVLRLANGKMIVLDSAADGLLMQQGNTKIIKTINGRITYDNSDNPEVINEPLFNTITIPCGGHYRLTLSDGTQVWLNAASSLTYPVSFYGSERKVSITGEAYFEVAQQKNLPFQINAGKMNIEVLGTKFNINAYPDEATVNTTLLEGSVKIQHRLILHPGEQASLRADGKLQLDKYADTEQVTAWKNGFFSFKNASLQTVMRQISRWYDVDINYTNNMPDQVFEGEIQRSLNLSQVLKILNKMDVHFNIEGKKITVLP